MNGDFGTDLDAALNDRLTALRDAADAARARVTDGAGRIEEAVQPSSDLPPASPPEAAEPQGFGDFEEKF